MSIGAFALVATGKSGATSFCRLKLVAGGPKPRWEIDNRVSSFPPGEVPNDSDIARMYGHQRQRHLPLLVGVLSRLTVTRAQICQLFPETRSMPLVVALDYVRDRL